MPSWEKLEDLYEEKKELEDALTRTPFREQRNILYRKLTLCRIKISKELGETSQKRDNK